MITPVDTGTTRDPPETGKLTNWCVGIGTRSVKSVVRPKITHAKSIWTVMAGGPENKIFTCGPNRTRISERDTGFDGSFNFKNGNGTVG